jgi:hypothetical protein
LFFTEFSDLRVDSVVFQIGSEIASRVRSAANTKIITLAMAANVIPCLAKHPSNLIEESNNENRTSTKK